MKVKIARRAGFCMGVRRAMRLALKAAETSFKPVYTYGPLIHNPQALELLEKLGIRDLKKTEGVREGIVIIRAHGIPPEEKEALLRSGLEVIDGTCPRVAKVQALARKYTREGYQVIIIGDADHAEVKGILGYTEGRGLVVSNFRDLENLPPLEKYVILSQTTQDEELFEFLSQEILQRHPGGEVINTICHATHVRQECVRNLSRECEAIVVVGGRGSANTNRLVQIAREEEKEAYLVETPEELPLEELSRFSKIGVSAGASTPNWLINGVVEKLKGFRNPIRRLLWVMLNSHLVLAGGLAALTAGNALWLGHSPRPWLILTAFLMAFFAHTWNVLTALGPLSLCHPYKADFFRRHQRLFLILTLSAFPLALLGAFLSGPGWLAFTALAGGLSALYSLSFLRTLFPGNRAFFIALFWTALSLFYAFEPPLESRLVALTAGLAFLLAFFRTLYLDLLDLFEDGFLGLESLAAYLEEKRTFYLLYVAVIVGMGLSFWGTTLWGFKALGLVALWGYALCLVLYLRKKPLGRRLCLEYLGESLSYFYLLLALLLRP